MKAAARWLLRRLGYEVRGIRLVARQLLDPQNLRVLEFDDIVCRRLLGLGRTFNFIQVGAFDGVTRDPLRRFIEAGGWHGVLVEPQPIAAARLRSLYAGHAGIKVLQAAVGETAGSRTLYTVASDDAPSWAGGLASFDRNNVMKHADQIPNLANMLREEIVVCMPFDEILKEIGAAPLDLLQIDTEGADAEVLACFPFQQVRPAIVHWEVKHLSKAQREATFERLLGFGYRLAPSGDEDMLALDF